MGHRADDVGSAARVLRVVRVEKDAKLLQPVGRERRAALRRSDEVAGCHVLQLYAIDIQVDASLIAQGAGGWECATRDRTKRTDAGRHGSQLHDVARKQWQLLDLVVSYSCRNG